MIFRRGTGLRYLSCIDATMSIKPLKNGTILSEDIDFKEPLSDIVGGFRPSLSNIVDFKGSISYIVRKNNNRIYFSEAAKRSKRGGLSDQLKCIKGEKQ